VNSAPHPIIAGFADDQYDPFESDVVNFGEDLDPYPQIHTWRTQGPVLRGAYRDLMGTGFSMTPGAKCYTVIGTQEVIDGLGDPETFSNSGYEGTIGATFGLSLSVMDNPEHRKYRQPFQKMFLPHNVKRWGHEIVDPIVHRLMAMFQPRGEADLVQQFTILYPFEVIYKQLDLPTSDIEAFQRIAIAQTDYFHADKAAEAGRRLGIYFKELIDERRKSPKDDLISMLASMRVEGAYVDEEVLISFLRQLMNAGGDTTYRGTSVLMVGLLQNPDQLEAVRDDRSLIPQAIEEALRWEGPVLSFLRQATRDTEIAGVSIPKGAAIDFLGGAANHDPMIFNDPDKFNIFRPRTPNFAFARGPHICVGQHLARVEMTRALHAILDNLHNLRLDPDRPAPQIRGCIMRAPHHIHVRFDPN
jgi:cytochrome P450